ncbi:MAG: DHH family phosphoesterase [Candidatus Dojkabacteria bacterium]|jgi:phosphoesterase RecJ-like protein|nr:DHH family phosphoesterase [Candidatus Dojkabacteria bacterium]
MVREEDCRRYPVFCKRIGTDVGQSFYISDILEDMKKEYRKLHSLIKKSQNILILTHKGPDFDAFASGLILKNFLNTYYPKKAVTFKARQSPTQNIPFMHEIQVASKIDGTNEELVILTDSSGWNMCVTGQDTIQLTTKAKVAVIDHHDTIESKADVTINNNMSSATEQVLDFCMEVKGNYKITKEISELGQIGIIADTGRFLYENATPHTYELMAKLRKIYELDIEDFEYRNTKLPVDALLPIKIYLQNIHIQKDMSFTYLTNKDIKEFGLTKTGINNAQMFLRDNIIRNIQGVHWGFIAKPSYLAENEWYVSFRSTKGYQQVDKIAETLDGGGHQYSSACKVKANDGDEASRIVLETITKVLSTTPSSPPSPTP